METNSPLVPDDRILDSGVEQAEFSLNRGRQTTSFADDPGKSQCSLKECTPRCLIVTRILNCSQGVMERHAWREPQPVKPERIASLNLPPSLRIP